MLRRTCACTFFREFLVWWSFFLHAGFTHPFVSVIWSVTIAYLWCLDVLLLVFVSVKRLVCSFILCGHFSVTSVGVVRLHESRPPNFNFYTLHFHYLIWMCVLFAVVVFFFLLYFTKYALFCGFTIVLVGRYNLNSASAPTRGPTPPPAPISEYFINALLGVYYVVCPLSLTVRSCACALSFWSGC